MDIYFFIDMNIKFVMLIEAALLKAVFSYTCADIF